MATTLLVDWLRTSSDDTLATLLRIRRDLATPPPSDLGLLATRASTSGSVSRACESLDTFTLAVLDALLLLEADREPVSLSSVSDLVGADTRDALNRLRTRVLAWGPDDAIQAVPAAREVVGPYPAGLGGSSDALSTVDIQLILAETDSAEQALLATLAAGPPIGRTRDAGTIVSLAQATTPVQKLLARGLLIRRNDETVELPKQVGIALRQGRVFTENVVTEPELPTITAEQSTVDQVAAGEALELLRQMESLLTLWSEQPPPVLKTGGLGVRELRKFSRQIEADIPRAILVAELAVAAGLVINSQEDLAEWVPTVLADSWLASTSALRWVTLAQAWLDLPRFPGLASDPTVAATSKDKPAAPLSEELRRPLAPTARRRVLHSLADLPRNTGVKNVADLVSVLAWRAPRQGGRLRDEVVRWTMAEAAALGLIGLGAITTATSALLDDDRAGAATEMTKALPTPIDHVLLQADLTVVAPGPLEPELAAEIGTVADVESSGHATVYRITEASVRRALDTGRSAAELHELFATKSITPVPQSLSYLIDDVARRHGRLRGGAAGSFLRCDDEVLLTEVLASPVAEEYELRRIAPTVLISPLPLSEVIAGLRAAGFAPIAEGFDGRVLDLRPGRRRIMVKNRQVGSRPMQPAEINADQLTAIIAHLRAGDKTAGKRRGTTVRLPGGGGADTSATLALLAQATRDQRDVWIGFVDANGIAIDRIITPLRVDAGVLESVDHDKYPLHRITSAALVEE